MSKKASPNPVMPSIKEGTEYTLYETCDLITASSPVYLSELYQKLDDLDNLNTSEIVKLVSEDLPLEKGQQPLTLSDFFEGLAQLTTTGAVEMTEIVEALHAEALLRPLGLFNDYHLQRWQSGIISRLYNVVRATMTNVGNKVTKQGVMLYKKSLIKRDKRPLPESLKLLANIMNGMMGDHLVRRHNPLAVPMMFYDRYGQPLKHEVFGRVVILCHGLCLSYLSWQPCEEDSLGEVIANDANNVTVLYLDYNTGQRISQNGQCLAKLLQDLVDNNPEITQIDLVGYSMGGLVTRSALFYGEHLGLDWVVRVGNLITMGTPHQGAGLERISYHMLEIMGDIPFAGAFSKLGDIRSAGIIDLRHGSTRDEDWKYLKSRDVLPEEFRYPTKLPRHIKPFFIAASIAEGIYDSKASNLVGDGLVTIESALGEAEGEHNLAIPEGHKAVFYGVNHFHLMYDKRVHELIRYWLNNNGEKDFSMDLRIQSFPQSYLADLV